MSSNQSKNLSWKWAGPVLGVFALLGAFLSRLHGGLISGWPKLLKAFLWSLPFAICVAIGLFLTYGFSWVTFIAVLVTMALTMVFKNTGHGGGMDVAHSPKEPGAGRTPEKLEYLILWLHGQIPQYWYDVLLLAVIGLFSTLPAAIACLWLNPWASLSLLLGGAVGKPLAYMIGWVIYPQGKGLWLNGFDEATAIGEALTGWFAYLSLGVACLLIFFGV